MAILKPISGHGNLVGNHCRDYMLGIGPWEEKYHGNRCQRVTYINMLADEVCEKNWAQRMDEDRKKQGTDIPLNDKKVRTYNQYIFSPDPRDNITIDELDAAIKEWAERVFQNKFSIVIGYQNDNTNKIQHAHMYINNVNWSKTDTKKRIGTYVTPQCWEFASQLWQYMCDKRGWHSFIEKQMDDILFQQQINRGKYDELINNENKELNQLFSIDKKYFKKYYYFCHDIDYSRPYKKLTGNTKTKSVKPVFSSKEGRRYTKGALEAKKRGEHLWTDDIRDLIEIAYYQTDNLSDFITTLDRYDVSVKLTKNKDFKYYHPDNPETMQVTGRKLGNDYTRSRLLILFAQAKSRSKDKNIPKIKDYKLLVKKIREIGYTIETKHLSYVNNSPKLLLEDVARAMKICSYLNAWNVKDIEGCKNLQLDNNPEMELVKDVITQLENINPVREMFEKQCPIEPKSKFDVKNIPQKEMRRRIKAHNKKQEKQIQQEEIYETQKHIQNKNNKNKKDSNKKINKYKFRKR